MKRRPLIAGNWKMNGLLRQLTELQMIAEAAGEIGEGRDLLICPPATILSASRGILGQKVAIGGQDCHAAPSGAHTGDLSAEMLADVGARYVIVGHSERRADHDEDDAAVRAKAEAAWRAGLVAIVCIGESEAQREAGETLDVLGAQVAGSVPDGATGANLVLAYEPVWAIGTGRTAAVEDIADAHGFLRRTLVERLGEERGAAVRILYGGSVKPGNAAELLAIDDVDGALVGGASLKADDFIAICRATPVG
ncbi:triose-phosphate isomerase [Aurantimonas sp. VKM B-3413]|uniref:triose-phosphate isomerase n=1 Tax=Aurantimonas sp. VKM B-3413 TaxID=2779401 RepID=UPI001E5442D3|nr:triose-phosphate isomerase [Aurantimonas sp. VKM B-3413]MCB8838554.1 triose-phosphate isomerase [Aurantimonas sp. VKM B-3413]